MNTALTILIWAGASYAVVLAMLLVALVASVVVSAFKDKLPPL